MAQKSKTVFICGECGYETSKWYGKCPGCGEWNTFEEVRVTPQTKERVPAAVRSAASATPLGEITGDGELRFSTGISELDRVFGGGMVKGSAVLIGGDPGIGKSTIVMQACQHIGRDMPILYVSGEESKGQLKLRADRLGVDSENLSIFTGTSIDDIEDVVARDRPGLLIVDSIQTVYNPGISSIPGSISQVKDCSQRLIGMAKRDGFSVLMVGHINKEGAIAGPKVLEHLVDAVLVFEGDHNLTHRVLRATKNRYGSTNEIGLFEMEENGLIEVENPSSFLLDGKPVSVPGNCITSIVEGTRPILAEVQALLSPSGFGNPRRAVSGFDYNRVIMLLAVLEKRGGMKISASDVYVNVIGGIRLTETASDLAVILAAASSFRERPVADGLIAVGEVGLAGEVRSVKNVRSRVSEAARLGFTHAVVPKGSGLASAIPGMELVEVGNIYSAIDAALR